MFMLFPGVKPLEILSFCFSNAFDSEAVQVYTSNTCYLSLSAGAI